MKATGEGRTGDFHLEPETGIDLVSGSMVATSADAWLKVTPARALASRRWVRLRYRLSFFDDPVRPLIRFTTSEGRQFFQPMNGPVTGCGEWIGRVPDKTISASISPVKTFGRFDFRLDSITPISRRSLLQRGLLYDRKSLLLAVGGKIINAEEERWETLKFAASATPFEAYDQWYRQRERPVDIGGIDCPRADWNASPAMQLVMQLRPARLEQLKATLASLREQIYPRWTLHAVRTGETPASLLAGYREEMAADPRLREAAKDADFFSNAGGGGGRDFVAIIELGDLIPNYAFAVIAETAMRAPNLCIVYGDEDALAADGKLHSPVFKPAWSPIFFAARPYLGRLTCIRYRTLAECGVRTAGELIRDEIPVLKRLAASAATAEVHHTRRVLYRRRREVRQEPGVADAPARIATSNLAASKSLPEVTIIVPTRDRAKLLAQCMKGVREKTDYPAFDVIIVDNGSVQADARALLQELGRQPRVKVLSRPGKFNFSALCNDGARSAKTPILVFLNNDIVIFAPAWLRALVRWAMRPEVGIVGAKLLFPDNTIEHAGVVLGHGGIAGHIYPWQAASEPGHLHELTVPHEVAAVTGACIAIQREKFEAVGGFDAENLPVDLNDIDLCLRVAERGWKTVWTPEAVLYHLQSASRGFQLKPSKVYQKERDYFQRRWAQAIRDDPFFHPALSLFSHRPALA